MHKNKNTGKGSKAEPTDKGAHSAQGKKLNNETILLNSPKEQRDEIAEIVSKTGKPESTQNQSKTGAKGMPQQIGKTSQVTARKGRQLTAERRAEVDFEALRKSISIRLVKEKGYTKRSGLKALSVEVASGKIKFEDVPQHTPNSVLPKAEKVQDTNRTGYKQKNTLYWDIMARVRNTTEAKKLSIEVSEGRLKLDDIAFIPKKEKVLKRQAKQIVPRGTQEILQSKNKKRDELYWGIRELGYGRGEAAELKRKVNAGDMKFTDIKRVHSADDYHKGTTLIEGETKKSHIPARYNLEDTRSVIEVVDKATDPLFQLVVVEDRRKGKQATKSAFNAVLTTRRLFLSKEVMDLMNVRHGNHLIFAQHKMTKAIHVTVFREALNAPKDAQIVKGAGSVVLRATDKPEMIEYLYTDAHVLTSWDNPALLGQYKIAFPVQDIEKRIWWEMVYIAEDTIAYGGRLDLEIQILLDKSTMVR